MNKTIKNIGCGFIYGLGMGAKNISLMWKHYTLLMLGGTLAHILVVAYSYHLGCEHSSFWYGMANWMIAGTLVNIAFGIITKLVLDGDAEKRDRYINDVVKAAVA